MTATAINKSNNKTAARRRFGLPARGLTLGVATALFAGLCVLPVVYMLATSLTGPDGIGVENYRRLLAAPRQRQLLWTSTLLGAGTALLSTALGAPLGLLLARADVPAKRLFRLALVTPLVIPPYVLALAWILASRAAETFAGAGVGAFFSGQIYSLTGAVLVLGGGFYPIPMLATEAAARRVDGHLEEAALLVAPPRRVLRRITLPLIAPTVAASALIVFVLALAEFGVPGLLRVPVFTTEVFTAFAALYDFGAATSLAVPLLVLALAVGVATRLVIGERPLTTSRTARPGLRLPLDRWRPLALAGLTVVLAVTVAVPLAALASEAGRVGRVASVVWASGEAVVNSILLAFAGATLVVALALPLGYLRARSRVRWRGALDAVCIVIFAVPSTVVGVGLIGLWNRPGLLGEVYTSPAIILVAYLARFVPVAALILAASVRQVSMSFEEAAEMAGASWPRTFAGIVVPQVRTGLAAAWVVTYVFAFGELGATVLVAPPGESTLPVRVYTLIANTPSGEVAALALAQAVVVLIPLVLFGIFTRERRGGRAGG